MPKCKVCLDNYNEVYFVGSEIRGRFECNFKEATKVRNILIRIKCQEYNSWSTGESLEGTNHVFLFETELFSSVSASTELPSGKYVYHFSYNLPQDLPSTFKGPYGSISYQIKGIVQRPKRSDYEDVLFITVATLIDFNKMFRELQNKTTYSDEETVCSWCCHSGYIRMDVDLPKKTFVAGETIPFRVHVVNTSGSNVHRLEVKLVKTVTSKVTSPHSESRETVANIIKLSKPGVGANDEHAYSLELEIPSDVEVPNFQNCALFGIRYHLLVSAKMAMAISGLGIRIEEVQMGHVQRNQMNNILLPNCSTDPVDVIYWDSRTFCQHS